MIDTKKMQEQGRHVGEVHWDNFLGEEKRHEYTNGFQHGYKHGYEDGHKAAVAERQQRTLSEVLIDHEKDKKVKL